ncbi:hypothetical protein FQN57_003463 [Myotisia sp. PD_48]|nr:hypothetical protein FQN57_003463 [Myotisia sp. PD_48]
MQLRLALQLGLLLFSAPSICASSGWGFTDATVSIHQKGTGVGNTVKEKLSPSRPVSKPLAWDGAGTIKLFLTAQENGSTKIPHQLFLSLKDKESGLDVSYPLEVKGSGKARLELTHKDLPTQFLRSKSPIEASLLIASFGTSTGYDKRVFQLNIARDPHEPLPSSDALRYGKLEEIHHIFKPGPTSPPVILSLIFSVAVLSTLPLLVISWLYIGANVDHLSVALKSSPISHLIFGGSIVGLELIFFLYYTTWNLFQTLPAVLAMGTVAVISGSRALGEVQERRLAGLR